MRDRTLGWVRERWVQVVDDLAEDVGVHLVAGLIQEEDVNRPELHWVSLNLRNAATARRESADIFWKHIECGVVLTPLTEWSPAQSPA